MDEGPPGRSLASFRCRLEPVCEQRVLDGVSGDVVAEVVKRPANPGISPAGKGQEKEVEVHLRGDERQPRSGGKFQGLGEADL